MELGTKYLHWPCFSLCAGCMKGLVGCGFADTIKQIHLTGWHLSFSDQDKDRCVGLSSLSSGVELYDCPVFLDTLTSVSHTCALLEQNWSTCCCREDKTAKGMNREPCVTAWSSNYCAKLGRTG